MIPVAIVTGFLGSGKTTLISRVLRDPGFTRTAVIVNEFGEIGLDHDLITSSDDSVLTLASGCVCCAVQSDLGRTLTDLLERRAAGLVHYDRVLIETSGLSDPAPVLQGMMTDGVVAGSYAIPSVVTLVDTIHGETTLREHAEARSQVALADRILISKTDLGPMPDGLVTCLDGLNGRAVRTATSQVAGEDFFAASAADGIWDRLDRVHRGRAHAGIDTFSVVRERAMPALALTMLLQAVAEHCGPRLLRLKGLVAIEEMPGQPAVIHGVRHVITAPEFLDRWPGDDRRTRIVFIAKDVPRHFVSRLLDAIEEDVREEMGALD